MKTAKRRKGRRGRIVALALALELALLLFAGRAQALVDAVHSIGLTVSDLDRSVEFFSTVLSFEKISEIEVAGSEYERLFGVPGARTRVVRMKLGGEIIELTQYVALRGRPIPAGSRSHDRWFRHIAIVVSDMERAYEKLRVLGVRHTSSAPQRIPDTNKAAGGVKAFYFKSPDGHDLELIHFPAGKGDPKWQQTHGRLFLGIDHTAIVVSDTERSLRFYRDLLGLKLGGVSENFGAEQDRLNNLSGSRVRISGLAARAGAGVEFLHYLAPGDGRAMPADTRANDLWHWHTAVTVNRAAAAAQKLKAAGVRFVSSDVARFGDRALGFKQAFIVRDADGHGLKVVEK